MKRATGAVRRDGTPHTQPHLMRRVWCVLTGGHRQRFDICPALSCHLCGWWPPEART